MDTQEQKYRLTQAQLRDLDVSKRPALGESGKAIRLGDQVTVQVERVDAPRGRTDLSPVIIGGPDAPPPGQADRPDSPRG